MSLLPGKLEVDYTAEIWDDHDENCHGPMDTDENISEWPEAFLWSCCKTSAIDDGCKTGRHIPQSPQNKKQRIN